MALQVHIERKQIARLAPVCPEPVWIRGELPDFADARPFVALVGARSATRRALEQAHELAFFLASRGAVVISGGALGVDGAAHRGALAAAGLTIAVLGNGVDVPYPSRHRGLFDDILGKGGALLSPFPPGSAPVRWHFPRRNRLIAALCDGVVVVQAQPRSGALSTARAGRELGRRVMAVPGSPGCDALLLAGAYAVDSGEDVLGALVGRRRHRTRPDGEIGRVLEACDWESARTVEEISERAELPLLSSHSALLRLTLMRYVARLPGERYKRLETVV